MLIIPAIDLKNGRCVRLRQGKMDRETIYSDDPIATAGRWVEAGARRLHIVDLDGASYGKPENMDIIHEISHAFPQLPIQVGGGIRDQETIQNYLDAGVSYAILGTRAVSAPQFVADACLEFPGQIMISLDSRNGKLATDGWGQLSERNAKDTASLLEEAGEGGLAAIIFTDIKRDGMLNSANVEETLGICEKTSIPVIAAGGIADLDDISALCALARKGLAGAITGRAIYEGTLDLAAAQRLADKLCPQSAQSGEPGGAE